MENQLTLCTSCSKALPANGYFCSNCLTQFKCKECDTLLLKDSIGCINCGTPSIGNNATQNKNTFRLHETLTDRTIEATFSNEVGKDLAGILRDSYTSRKTNLPSPHDTYLNPNTAHVRN